MINLIWDLFGMQGWECRGGNRYVEGNLLTFGYLVLDDSLDWKYYRLFNVRWYPSFPYHRLINDRWFPFLKIKNRGPSLKIRRASAQWRVQIMSNESFWYRPFPFFDFFRISYNCNRLKQILLQTQSAIFKDFFDFEANSNSHFQFELDLNWIELNWAWHCYCYCLDSARARRRPL